MELKDTIEQMTSSDYKQRFLAEYNQLKIRYDKLCAFIDKAAEGKLDFEPSCCMELHFAQACAMENYLKLLELRADIEDVDLGGE